MAIIVIIVFASASVVCFLGQQIWLSLTIKFMLKDMSGVNPQQNDYDRKKKCEWSFWSEYSCFVSVIGTR